MRGTTQQQAAAQGPLPVGPAAYVDYRVAQGTADLSEADKARLQQLAGRPAEKRTRSGSRTNKQPEKDTGASSSGMPRATAPNAAAATTYTRAMALPLPGTIEPPSIALMLQCRTSGMRS